MLIGKEWKTVPNEIRNRITDTDCRKSLRFPDGREYECPGLCLYGDRGMSLPVFDEHSDLGRALIDALWFSRPVELCLKAEGEEESRQIPVCVYRCHIAGELYKKRFLEAKAEQRNKDMESVWELRVLAE